jgi:hypothetical protein
VRFPVNFQPSKNLTDPLEASNRCPSVITGDQRRPRDRN